MKTIEPVSVWDNGVDQNVTVLNTYGISVILGSSATFSYELYYVSPIDLRLLQARQSQLTMTGDAYLQWSSDDEYAWDWVASQLNLTITGNYVPPVPPEPTTTTTSTEAPATTTTTTIG